MSVLSLSRIIPFFATALIAPVALACGGPGWSALLRVAPTAIPKDAALLEVIVDPRWNRNAQSGKGVPAKVVRVIYGQLTDKKIVIDFESMSSCEFLRASGKPQYLVGSPNLRANGTVHLAPVLYSEKWVQTPRGFRFEGMEQQ